jgi:hypothetical protein
LHNIPKPAEGLLTRHYPEDPYQVVAFQFVATAYVRRISFFNNLGEFCPIWPAIRICREFRSEIVLSLLEELVSFCPAPL